MITLPVSMSEAMESGNPFFIELYTIQLRTSTLFLVAADEDVTFAGQKYLAVPIKREEINRSLDSIINDCQLEVSDCSDDLLRYVLNGYDFRGCKCNIIRIQYPDSLEDITNFSWVFSGEIDEPSFSDGVFTCKVFREFPQIQVPNRDYKLACNSAFGDEDCQMDKCETEITVKKISSNILQLDKSYDEGYWNYGTITMEGESRTIIKSTGNEITLNLNFLQDFTERKATLVRGCNKTQSMCKKYGNMINFSGFPAIPFENIYA